MHFLGFLIPFAACTALVLSAVSAVNAFVDVRGVYHRDQRAIQSYVARLSEAPNGLVALPMERAIKLELARTRQAHCYVLGSSRVMLIGSQQIADLGLACHGLVNLAVSGAAFEDLVTLSGPLHGKLQNSTVVLNIDPWTMRPQADLRYLEETAAYEESRAIIGLAADPSVKTGWREKLTNLINGQYFQRNIRSLIQNENRATIVAVLPDGTNLKDDDTVTLPDGSRQRSRAVRHAAPIPESRIGNGNAKIAPPFLDTETVQAFNTLLDFFQREGARVILFMAPYHPKVLHCGSMLACDAMIQVSNWVHTVAQQRNLVVVGGFDPRPFGLGGEDFSDDLHMVEAAFARLRPNN